MKIFILLITILVSASCSKRPLFNDPKVKNSPNNSRTENSSEERDVKKKLLGLGVHVEWETGPRNVNDGESILSLYFWDITKSTTYGPYLLPEKKICVLLWMVMPDGSEHGSAPVTIKKMNSEDGPFYKVSELYFLMNGLWQVRVRAVNNEVR